jgi:aldehyde:ferredoxin oxidoreductase
MALIDLTGDIVYVNLGSRQITRERCPEEILAHYLGGRGLTVRLLLEHLSGSVMPLDPENVLVISSGLLSGSRMITTGRVHLGARSPLTGLIGCSNGGGKFGADLKRCGILALVVTGKADEPLFINIKDNRITLEKAASLWGLPTGEARSRIFEAVGDNRASVILIGPAGENLSSLACVATDIGHAAGRTGMGAVMGSKNLKAVVARSTGNSRVKSSADATASVKRYLASLRELPGWEGWVMDGSSADVSWTDQMGASGAKNFSSVCFEGVETACGSHFRDILVKHRGCYNCPIRCRALVKIDQGRHRGYTGDRGEYEPLSSWGPRCGNADGHESIYLLNKCDDYGIDNKGAGNLVAFAMDLYERGILTKEDTGGLELTWGNMEAAKTLLDEIVCRSTPLGDLLSRGIKEAAAAIGGEAEQYAFHVKGLSLSIMDPRGFKATGLGYAVSSRGGDFSYVYAKPEFSYSPEQAFKAYGSEKASDRLLEEGKPRMVKECICANAVIDSLGICKIPELGMLLDFDLNIAAGIVSDFSGEKISGAELLKIGERIVNAERLLNFRFGATGVDDSLPEKFTTEPIAEGPCKGSVINLESMLQEYYRLMGWSSDGVIGPVKLEELGLTRFSTGPAQPGSEGG